MKQPIIEVEINSADAPKMNVFEMYELLTDENKEAINLLVEQLIAEQS